MMGLAGSSKSRKPYKITKPRERWSEEEHEKFLEAIDRFGRNWKDIVSFVGTRSVSQEFLRRCNSSGVNTPAVAELASCTLPQPMPATARGTNVHMLQESDQQSCPQLDGTFLADVIKASSAPPSLSVHSLSQPIIAGRSLSASSTRSPLGSAFHMGLKGNQEPSQSVSPTTSFQTLPSNSSILTVKPDVELCAADTHLDSSFGLDEQDFWADFSLEDPLMQAVDAAMGCGASADSCL
ncbi:MAG: transcription factor ASG4-like [Trebouxia sp. A1-2]|nr:MAG: transcription factor ASG4-like [Trebouxia sp. A1-2]